MCADIRVIIVHRHEVILDGIQAELREEPAISVQATAQSGQEALTLLKRKKTDVILMADQAPDSIEATQAIVEEYPKVKVLMMAMNNSENYISRMMVSDAHGSLLINAGKKELIRAVLTVHKEGEYFTPEVNHMMIKIARRKKALATSPIKLTLREREVLQGIHSSMSNKQIAKHLGIEESTVKFHRVNLYAKYGVHDIAGLLRESDKHGTLTYSNGSYLNESDS